MIDALVGGSIVAELVAKTGRSGKRFVASDVLSAYRVRWRRAERLRCRALRVRASNAGSAKQRHLLATRCRTTRWPFEWAETGVFLRHE